jgi:hypothetical protein
MEDFERAALGVAWPPARSTADALRRGRRIRYVDWVGSPKCQHMRIAPLLATEEPHGAEDLQHALESNQLWHAFIRPDLPGRLRMGLATPAEPWAPAARCSLPVERRIWAIRLSRTSSTPAQPALRGRTTRAR